MRLNTSVVQNLAIFPQDKSPSFFPSVEKEPHRRQDIRLNKSGEAFIIKRYRKCGKKEMENLTQTSNINGRISKKKYFDD